MQLRPYQVAATDAAISWMKRSVMPGVLELATGAGKSLIVAAIATWVYESTGKRVLCLQPSKELTEQNAEKYRATGQPCSIFSASSGSKCMRHPVVYGTPGTVKNSLSRFGDQFGAVIIDEAHGITDTIKLIVGTMQKANPRLRVMAMTATPFRTVGGYIYQYDLDGSFVPEDQTRDPWFNTLLYRITTGELIDMGFLTPAHADPEHATSYEAADIQLNSRGQFDAADVERVFEGQGRLTAEIVADVVSHSAGRAGVMLFAATVQHAKEILQSLPPENSRMLGGDVNMKKDCRAKLIADFKARRFKYLVSVATLTTGFDAPHVSLVAILRATESPGLFQQIIGRSLRLADPATAGDHNAIACSEKPEALILDYAENIERHSLHNDLFTPQIRVKGGLSGGGTISAECPDCSYQNEFSARPNPDEFQVSEDGYFLDLAGAPVETEHGPMPGHHGRRCTGQIKAILSPGVYERCTYRWTFKECPECEGDNDITARYCRHCKVELVDPNEKLQRDFARIKKDPYTASTDEVLDWNLTKGVSASGNETLRVEIRTAYRKFAIWLTPGVKHSQAVRDWEMFSQAVYKGHVAPSIDIFLQHIDKGQMPSTVTYARRKGSDFYRAFAYNNPADRAPE